MWKVLWKVFFKNWKSIGKVLQKVQVTSAKLQESSRRLLGAGKYQESIWRAPRKERKVQRKLKDGTRKVPIVNPENTVFRAPREADGRSTPVHGRVTLRTSPRTQQKNYMKGDRQIYI